MTPADVAAYEKADQAEPAIRDRCGDWLLTWGSAEAPRHGRTQAKWQLVQQTGNVRLWLQAPVAGWAGGPWRELRADGSEELARPETLWIHGEIFGSVRRAWDLVRASGNTPQHDPWGHYLLIHHTADGRWTVATDRYGTLHAYAAELHGKIRAIGSSFAAVQGACGLSRADLDWQGLAGFFGHGFFTADRTFLKGIRVIRPASRLRIDSEGFCLRDRWCAWRHDVDPHLTFDDAVDELAQRLGRVMADMGQGEVAMPISGGLDSRSTVAELPADRRPWSYSYGWGPAAGRGKGAETRIAAQVARARGLPFEAFEVGPYLFEPFAPGPDLAGQTDAFPGRDHLDAVVAATEGFQDPLLPRQAAVWRHLARHESVIAAHWGDVWLDSAGLAEATPGATGNTQLIEHLMGKFHKPADWLLKHVARPHLEIPPDELFRQQMGQELERLAPIEEADFRAKALKTELWSWRWTCSSLRVYQAAAFPRLPFYDPRVTELFESLPASFLVGRRLQIEFLKRHAPDLAKIPWQVYGADLWRYRHFNTWMLPERALRKLKRLWRPQPTAERNWEVQLRGKGRAHLRRELSGSALLDLVPPKVVQSLLTAFESRPTPELGYQVSMLLGFARWLEGTPRLGGQELPRAETVL